MIRRVAITGGYGYLGGRIASHLHAQGFAVTLLARRAGGRRPAWAADMNTLELDLADTDSLARGLKGAEAVIHLAAMNARACAADPELARTVNVGGTANVVQAARAAGADHVIYMSTAHVYASPLSGRLDEDAPTLNTHAYAATHRDAETRVIAGGGTVLRLSNGVGAPMDTKADCWMLVANDLCRQAVSEGSVTLDSTGKGLRDFIALSEVGRAVTHCLNNPKKTAGGTFNLAAGRATTLRALAELIAARAGHMFGHTFRVSTAPDDGVEWPAFELPADRLAATGFRAEAAITLEIDATLAFCRDHFAHA